VSARPIRRRFTAAYKLEVLRQADACQKLGEVGALLRREGLYSSHLSAWRRQRDQGALRALGAGKRGRRPQPRNPLAGRVAQLEGENRKLQRRLHRAETIIEIQKKASALLGIPLKSLDNESDD
jgi:transposase-like protein